MKHTAKLTFLALATLFAIGGTPARAGSTDARYYELQAEIRTLKSEIAELRAELADLNALIEIYNARIAHHEALIANCAWWLPGTQSMILAWQNEINRCRSIVAALEGMRDAVRRELRAKRAELRQANFELSMLPKPDAASQTMDSGFGSLDSGGISSTNDPDSTGTPSTLDSDQKN